MISGASSGAYVQMTKSVALVLVLGVTVTAAVDVDLDPLDPIVVRLDPLLLITGTPSSVLAGRRQHAVERTDRRAIRDEGHDIRVPPRAAGRFSINRNRALSSATLGRPVRPRIPGHLAATQSKIRTS
jgi:hypothetical protein